MNIGFISTRLAGNDGVSLETAKWAAVAKRMGHKIFYCAGELEKNAPPGMLVPEMHFSHQENMWIREHAYGSESPPELMERIRGQQTLIAEKLRQFINDCAIDVIVPQNILAVPLQIPLALAVAEVIRDTGIAAIAHNHDFYWERDCYQPNCVQDILDSVFPPNLPSIKQVSINSLARDALKTRRGIDSSVVPNVFDFATPSPTKDDFNADFRAAFGLLEDDIIALAPVRLVRRKGLQLAVELLGRLGNPHCKLVLTHIDDVEGDYLDELANQARQCKLDMRFVGDRISTSRGMANGEKIYLLWDAYLHADLVVYPSLYEGFGNALLEAMYFKKPVVINRYPVYKADIAPLGFDFIEIDGEITDKAVEQTRELLASPQRQKQMVEHNYRLALQHFSYEKLEALLRACLKITSHSNAQL